MGGKTSITLLTMKTKEKAVCTECGEDRKEKFGKKTYLCKHCERRIAREAK